MVIFCFGLFIICSVDMSGCHVGGKMCEWILRCHMCLRWGKTENLIFFCYCNFPFLPMIRPCVQGQTITYWRIFNGFCFFWIFLVLFPFLIQFLVSLFIIIRKYWEYTALLSALHSGIVAYVFPIKFEYPDVYTIFLRYLNFATSFSILFLNFILFLSKFSVCVYFSNFFPQSNTIICIVLHKICTIVCKQWVYFWWYICIYVLIVCIVQ